MQSILDEFLSRLASTVLQFDGIVNKFLGDGLLAIFKGVDAPANAVRCALRLVDEMARMREQWDANTNASLDFIDIGIGIATDKVILGAIGTARVRDFTVLGTGVNLAAHLTQAARQGRRILVDKRTYLAVREFVSADAAEEFELKKPDQPQGRRYERYCLRALAAPTGPSAPAARRDAARESSTRDGVFVSYSHRDRDWLRALQTHLRPYVRNESLTVWDDTQIRPGADWKREIGAALSRARVAVLLVSPHFLESEFVAREEWPALLAAAQQEGLTVIWFVLSACSYGETAIPSYQAALDPGHPLDSMTPAEQNRALVTVCQEIKRVLRA